MSFMHHTVFGKNASTGALSGRKVMEVSANLIQPLLANYRETWTQQEMEFSSAHGRGRSNKVDFTAEVVLK